MPKPVIRLSDDRPLLDVASYARPGPGRRDRLSPTEIEHISLTVHRAPEVMIKVLSRGGQDLGAVQRHIGYIGRYGDLDIETDEGPALRGREVGKELLENWDLDLDEHRRHAELAAAYGRQPPRLVHKLIFSMPPGTPPDKVLAAVRNFAREEFALKHRYALVLHTDEPQPHVHMVVKAVSEQGVRLNIRKAILRRWRAEFARHLRRQGVPANATERAVRGQSRRALKDGIYRAGQRGDSTHLRRLAVSVASDLLDENLHADRRNSRLVDTRAQVVRGWVSIARQVDSEGRSDLSTDIKRFVDQMPPPLSDRERIADAIRLRAREPKVRARPISP